MSEWAERRLDELGTVERGRSRHRPRNDPSLYGTVAPFFQTGDVKAAVLHLRRPQQWYSDLGVAQSRVWEAGVTCITIAANIADTAVLSSRGCFPDSVLGFTPFDQPEDSYFVKYLLDAHRERLAMAARGTTQDNLSLEKLLSFSFAVPDASVRRQIANSLRAIDELVENNRRRVEVLEEMARAIYREWFVEFRYPGHEDVPLVDSALGPIPEEWQVRRLGEVATFVGGSTATKASYVDSGFVAFSAAGPDGYLPDFEIEGDGVVLSAVGARCGRTFWASGRWSSIANTIKILPLLPSATAIWLFFATENPAIWPKRGSAQPFVSINDGRGVNVVTGDQFTHEHFEAIIRPLFEEAQTLRDQSDHLVAMRDLLLPKLVTGQIDVSKLDLDALLGEMVA